MAGQKAWDLQPSEPLPIDQLLERNKNYADSIHKPAPYLYEFGKAKMPSVLVLTCADMRCDPAQFLQYQPGEMAVVRNLAGRVGGELADIVVLDSAFQFREFIIVHHTDCGVTYTNESKVRDFMRSVLPEASQADIDNHPVRIFSDDTIEESVREDLQLVRDAPMLRQGLKDVVRGFVYDVKSGYLRRIQ